MDNRARLIPPHSARATVMITKSMMDKGQRNAEREIEKERDDKKESEPRKRNAREETRDEKPEKEKEREEREDRWKERNTWIEFKSTLVPAV